MLLQGFGAVALLEPGVQGLGLKIIDAIFRVDKLPFGGGGVRMYEEFLIWEFPKIRGTLFGGPYNKDPTI